ncbi:MAG TPA: lytic transglycosylase domain-containing protein [Thermoanaerobaculia bacterium]|nr:lytic transglycosylase domain-containing protein [Thermoanaerobaculia bacterium]
MSELKTSRPYRERFLDNFDRAQLRREVEAVKPRKKRFSGLRKKYATYALGASLALGGIGAPLKIIQSSHGGGDGSKATTISTTAPIDQQLVGDLKEAESIAKQVAGGVAGGVAGVAGGVQAAVKAPLDLVAEAPKKLGLITEEVRQEFFHKEVPFGSIIYQEAKKNNIRPELIAAVVQAESKFKPSARSGAGAIGLMQLVPRTGRWMGAKDLHNPAQNISAGAKYLKYLNERFDGNETAVIAAYNAGEGNVKRFRGVPPFKETRNYVKKVKNFEEEYHNRVQNRVAEAGSAATEVAEAR